MLPLLCASLMVFFEGLVLWSVFPTMSYYCIQTLGGDAGWVGVMFALMAGPKVFSNPLFGRLSDRIGRRPVLAIVTVGSICASLTWGLATSVAWLAVSRGIAGVFGAQGALGQTVVADATRPEKRAAGMGLMGAAFGLSMLLGPLIGGLVGHYWSYAAVGWVGAGVQAVSLLVILFVMPETHPRGALINAAADPYHGLRGVFRYGTVVPLLFVTLLMTFGTQEMTATFAMLAEDQYGFGAERTGYVFAVFGLVGIIVQGGAVRSLVPRLGEKRLCGAGLVALAAGLAVLGLRLREPVMWTGAALVGVGAALSMPTLLALLSRRVGARHQGSLLGVNQGVTSLGRALGALAGGFAYEHFSGTPFFFADPYFSSAIVVLVGVVVLVPVRGSEATEAINRGFPAERPRAGAGIEQ